MGKVVPEMWEPLEASTHEGKQWRERNKMISQVMQMLEKTDADKSLADALPVAFKTKADARGKFALQVLEHGKKAIFAHISVLTTSIESSELEAAEQAKQVSDAERAVKTAEGHQDAASQEFIDAENAWVGEESKVNELIAKMATFDHTLRKLEKELETAQSAMASFQELAKNFESLKERSNVLPRELGA